jgi:hypothetical protein
MEIRRNLFSQRLFEAKGGDAANLMKAQFAMFPAVLYFGHLKSKKFEFLPLTRAKGPRYTAIVSMSFCGFLFASMMGKRSFGDDEYREFLLENRTAILAGEKCMW